MNMFDNFVELYPQRLVAVETEEDVIKFMLDMFEEYDIELFYDPNSALWLEMAQKRRKPPENESSPIWLKFFLMNLGDLSTKVWQFIFLFLLPFNR